MGYNREKRIIYTYNSVILFALFFSPLFAKDAIVSEVGGSRLGDKLLFYCAVKYLALKYDLDFYYRPFELSDQFMLSTQDAKFDDFVAKKFSRIVNFAETSIHTTSLPTLFIAKWNTIETFSRCLAERHLHRGCFAHLHTMLTPLISLPGL